MGKNAGIEWTDHKNWGDPVTRKDGYILVLCKDYPGPKSNKGHVLLHRLVMACSLGRPLTSEEHVHHINGDKSDNRIQNLQLLSNSEHRRLHEQSIAPDVKKGRTEKLVELARKRRKLRIEVLCMCGCGQAIVSPDKKGRVKKFVQGHNQRGMKWSWNRG